MKNMNIRDMTADEHKQFLVISIRELFGLSLRIYETYDKKDYLFIESGDYEFVKEKLSNWYVQLERIFDEIVVIKSTDKCKFRFINDNNRFDMVIADDVGGTVLINENEITQDMDIVVKIIKKAEKTQSIPSDDVEMKIAEKIADLRS